MNRQDICGAILAGALALTPLTAQGQAVSGLNGKLSVEGGVAGSDHQSNGTGLASGSFSLPIGSSFGLQVDGMLGTEYGSFANGAGAHLFWRNPQSGLLGLAGGYSSTGKTNWGRIGGEGELYLSSLTLAAQAGYQFGDRGKKLKNGFTFDVKSGVYGGADLSLYATPNFMLTIGGGVYAGDLSGRGGIEWAPGWSGMALYADGAIGENSYYKATAGVRFYFGTDKPLMRRHREDDPSNRLNQGLIAEKACHRDTVFMGECVTAMISDRRLKRDIVKVGEFADGIGVYRYRYAWGSAQYVGVMAQELLATKPEAVIVGSDGFYRVDYSKLAMRPMTFEQWQQQRLTGRSS
jgi:hypothetical protein